MEELTLYMKNYDSIVATADNFEPFYSSFCGYTNGFVSFQMPLHLIIEIDADDGQILFSRKKQNYRARGKNL